MEWKDLIAAAGLVLVMGGWVFTKWKDRKHEIFKERLKRRLDMYDSVVQAILPFLNPGPDGAPHGDDLEEKLGTARTKMQLYGYDNEILGYENFVRGINRHDVNAVNDALRELTPMIKAKLRQELGYRSRD